MNEQPKQQPIERTAAQLATEMAVVIEDQRLEVMLMATMVLLMRIIKADTEGVLAPHLAAGMRALQIGLDDDDDDDDDDEDQAGHA
jgi:hypothetical protein